MDTSKISSELRSRDWIITIPAEGEKGIGRIDLASKLDSYTAYIGQMEQGESGYIHWQLLLSNENAIRFSTLKRLLPTAHLEPRKGSVRQAVAYVTKESTRVSGEKPLVKGEINFREDRGKRNDLAELREEILSSNISLASLLVSNPNAWKYERQCRALIEARNETKFATELRHIQVKVFYGKTGTGKTHRALEASHLEDIYRATAYGSGTFDGYNAHKVLVLDEFRGQIPVSQLLTMCEHYPHKMPARYADKQAAYETLIIISNDPPAAWYPFESDATKRALARRFTEVIEFNGRDDFRSLKRHEIEACTLTKWQSW